MRNWGELQGLKAPTPWELMRPEAPLLNQKEPLTGRAIEAVRYKGVTSDNATGTRAEVLESA
jgi:hypothetical protein